MKNATSNRRQISRTHRPLRFWHSSTLLLALLGLLTSSAHQLTAQVVDQGGEEYHFEHTSCFSADDYAAIHAMVDENVATLELEGKLKKAEQESIVSFGWPLKLKNGLTDPSYYAISNYVDEDPSGGIRDYSCGSRSYDGHGGTDIFPWPFPWHKMNNNEVEVIAAASGTIVARYDGNYDMQCSWIPGAQGNGIIIQHADGSRAWYWHLKKFSLTSKQVGATVAAGERLGVVGSSGISTGPHLHFEVYNNYYQLVDPWNGPCNAMGGQSWWAGQKPYYDPKVNKLMTHTAVPSMPQCGPDVLNSSTQFQAGSLIYFAAYYRDRLAGYTSTYTVRKPDNTVWQTWSNSASSYAPASYTYSSYWLPANAPTGTWKFQVTFAGQTTTHNFTVGSSCTQPTLNEIWASNITYSTARLNCNSANVSVMGYDWRYRRADIPTDWIDLPAGPANFFNISGLQPSVTYEFQVAIQCSANTWSAWSGSKLFATLGYEVLCANATGINCESYIGGSTASYSNQISSYSCVNWNESGPERIYWILLPSASTLTATLSNLSADLDIFILNACNPSYCVAFGDNMASAYVPAGTYYIVVDGYNGASGYYALTVTCNGPGELNNDESCNATLLNVGYSCQYQTYSNVGATATVNPPPPGGGCPTTGMKDVWFRLSIPSSGKVVVSTTPGSMTDAVVGLYYGNSCSNPTYFGCIDDNQNGDQMPDISISGTPGTQLWLRIWGYGGTTGTFNICAYAVNTFAGGSGKPIVNDASEDDNAEATERSAASPDDVQGNLLLYPNPAQDWLQIKLDGIQPDQPIRILVFDSKGNLVRSFEERIEADKGLETTMPVGDLPPGLYAVQVCSGEERFYSRFIKM